MITPEIITYIKSEKGKGTPEETIKTNLLNNGWRQEDVSEALTAVAANPALGNPAVPIDPVMMLQIKQYRTRVRWILFGILAVVIILFFGINYFSSGEGSAPFSGIVGTALVLLLIAYGISWIATIGISPRHNQALEIFGLVAKVLGAILLLGVIVVGLLFIFCLFAVNQSGF